MVLRDRPERIFVLECEGLFEAFPGMAGQALGHPGQVVRIRHAIEKSGIGGGKEDELDALDDLTHWPDGVDHRAGHVDEGLAVARVAASRYTSFPTRSVALSAAPVITMPP